MSESTRQRYSEGDLTTVERLVRVYQKPGVSGPPVERLHLLATVTQMLGSERSHINSVLTDVEAHLNAIINALRGTFESRIGMLVSGIRSDIKPDIEKQIALRQTFIDMMEEAEETSANLPGIYSRLQAAGWRPTLSLEQWTSEDNMQRLIAIQTETWLITQLEAKLDSLDALFNEFVRKDGSLTPQKQDVSESAPI